jgi:hypothetical protein
VIASAFASGAGTDPDAIGAFSTTFVAPTVQVTVAAGQSVYVSSTKYMGSSAGGFGLLTNVCFQDTAGGSVTHIGSGMAGGTVPAGTRIPWTATGVFSPPAGTYDTGLCVWVANPGQWDLNEFGSTSAVVFQP